MGTLCGRTQSPTNITKKRDLTYAKDAEKRAHIFETCQLEFPPDWVCLIVT